jgi:TonB family protein
MSFASLQLGRLRPVSMKARLLSLLIALLLVLPPLIARESLPAVRLAVAPKYPALTLAGRVYGQVTVRVTIDPAGSVQNASVTEGHPMLRESALVAARQWKFARSTVGARVTTLRFGFVILPDSASVSSQVIFLPPNGFEIRQKPPSSSVQDGDRNDSEPVANPISVT